MLFFKMTAVSQVGFPDCLLCFHGRSVFVELKSPSGRGRVSPRQQAMIDKLKAAGEEVYVYSSKEECLALIKRITNR